MMVLLIMISLGSCKYTLNGIYYTYVVNPPMITTKEEVAMGNYIVTIKIINDTTYYYYTQDKIELTKNEELLKTVYVLGKAEFSFGTPINKAISFDGYGDTIMVNFFDKNNKDSLHLSYYGNGVIKDRMEYEDGCLLVNKYFYPTGKIRQIDHRVNGFYQGLYLLYYESGALKCRGQYDTGEKDGIWLYFNETGDTIETQTWVFGQKQ